MVRYMIAGGFATGVDALIFQHLIEVYCFNYITALTTSFAFGVLINFTLCTLLVFKERHLPLWRLLIRHYLASLTGWALNLSLMTIFATYFFIKPLIVARLLAASCTFFLNFTVIKNFVFYSK